MKKKEKKTACVQQTHVIDVQTFTARAKFVGGNNSCVHRPRFRYLCVCVCVVYTAVVCTHGDRIEFHSFHAIRPRGLLNLQATVTLRPVVTAITATVLHVGKTFRWRKSCGFFFFFQLRLPNEQRTRLYLPIGFFFFFLRTRSCSFFFIATYFIGKRLCGLYAQRRFWKTGVFQITREIIL